MGPQRAPAESIDLPLTRVRLLGKFSATSGDRSLGRLASGKANELLSYLLLHRNVSHARETLAARLWENSTIGQAKDYLRHALWHLQATLARQWVDAKPALRLRVEPRWVCLASTAELWLDVAVVEGASAQLRGVPGEDLDATSLGLAIEATNLYRGDLLDGSTYEWCKPERERLRHAYIGLVDKILAYYDAHREYENGVDVGLKLLALDRAHERTHWRLMHLRYRSGDRSGALRQFEQCHAALEAELGVRPSRQTVALYERIRADNRLDLVRSADALDGEPDDVFTLLSDVLARLGRVESGLDELRQLLKGERNAAD